MDLLNKMNNPENIIWVGYGLLFLTFVIVVLYLLNNKKSNNRVENVNNLDLENITIRMKSPRVDQDENNKNEIEEKIEKSPRVDQDDLINFKLNLTSKVLNNNSKIINLELLDNKDVILNYNNFFLNLFIKFEYYFSEIFTDDFKYSDDEKNKIRKSFQTGNLKTINNTIKNINSQKENFPSSENIIKKGIIESINSPNYKMYNSVKSEIERDGIKIKNIIQKQKNNEELTQEELDIKKEFDGGKIIFQEIKKKFPKIQLSLLKVDIEKKEVHIYIEYHLIFSKELLELRDYLKSLNVLNRIYLYI